VLKFPVTRSLRSPVPRKIEIQKTRIAVVSAFLAVIILGDLAKVGLGTACSFGTGWLAVTCPMGFLQMTLAARDPLLQLWPSVALGALTIVAAGRYFCAWLCPTILVQDRFGRGAAAVCGALASLNPLRALGRGSSPQAPVSTGTAPSQNGGATVSRKPLARYGILGGSLLSSAIFGFPVFCAICPVGLFFVSLLALKRLFLGQEPGWELLIFPTIVAVEVLFARSWCRSICPLGALLGLLAPFNRLLRPSVDGERCLQSRGVNCLACERACPEEIALASNPDVPAAIECTKCLSCYEKCPSRAVGFANLPHQSIGPQV
jgi:ferredoxin-type protein NapH